MWLLSLVRIQSLLDSAPNQAFDYDLLSDYSSNHPYKRLSIVKLVHGKENSGKTIGRSYLSVTRIESGELSPWLSSCL
jgi:hypothetical protein